MTSFLRGTAGVLVAAPPSLHRQGLLATIQEHWPDLTCTLAPDPTQLPALLRQQAYALVVLRRVQRTTLNISNQ